MDTLSIRYDNFKKFCRDTIPDNNFIDILQSTPIDIFIHTLRIHHQSNRTVDEICDIIFEKADIDITKFKEEDIKRFNRYVSYFNEIISLP